MSLYFRSNLNFKIRDELMPEPLESIVVEIIKPRTRPIIIGTLYRPPSSTIDLFEQIETLFAKVDSSNAEFYLLGDLNCDLLSGKPHTCTKKLLELIGSNSFDQVIKEPTRITPVSRTLPDICISPLRLKILFTQE